MVSPRLGTLTLLTDHGTVTDQTSVAVGNEQTPSDTDPDSEVSADQVEEDGTDQDARVNNDEVLGKEISSGALPFTGLPVEQLLPLAGGAVATGAAIVRLSKERDGRERPDEPGEGRA